MQLAQSAASHNYPLPPLPPIEAILIAQHDEVIQPMFPIGGVVKDHPGLGDFRKYQELLSKSPRERRASSLRPHLPDDHPTLTAHAPKPKAPPYVPPPMSKTALAEHGSVSARASSEAPRTQMRRKPTVYLPPQENGANLFDPFGGSIFGWQGGRAPPGGQYLYDLRRPSVPEHTKLPSREQRR
uniref:Uncharacterized protein n=1 Tax=Oxyrrhis marina TaxID=2969 RepID=A0A7S3UIB7_OXYMA